MNSIVLYTSKTGFTKQYAEWIAEALGCECRPYTHGCEAQIRDYDCIIYGGWLMAGMISGYDKIRNSGIECTAVFGTGMSCPGESVLEQLAGQNKIEPEKVFYFEGGYNPKKVGFIPRMIVRMLTRSLSKKADMTEADMRILETASGMDRTDKRMIAPLLAYINSKNE